MFPYRSVAVLGSGKTANSVRECLARFQCEEVSPDQAEIVVSSPGIPPEDYPYCDAPIISEIEFAYRLFLAFDSLPTLVGITGTNGKTTVTSLIAHILECPTAGNIGTPLIDFVRQDERYPVLVVELSSYQLEGCVEFTVPFALILNITPDHLLRHKTMEAYAFQKSKLWQNHGASDQIFYNKHDVLVCENIMNAPSIKRGVDDSVVHLHEHPTLKGAHNMFNINISIEVALALGLDKKTIIDRVLTFKGVEHRLEYLGFFQGKLVINDSKSTNPDSTLTAIAAFSNPIHLIIGGDNKQLDYDAFIAQVFPLVQSITVYGELSVIMEGNRHVSLFGPLKEAIDYTFAHSQSGDIILFSPGSSSFDQFLNFEERGLFFKTYVKDHYV